MKEGEIERERCSLGEKEDEGRSKRRKKIAKGSMNNKTIMVNERKDRRRREQIKGQEIRKKKVENKRPKQKSRENKE